MEIHFYKSIEDNLDNPLNLYITHNDTIEAIKNKEPFINTVAITTLDFDLLKKGYRIFLHENGKVGELTLGENVLSDKFLREGHNFTKLWIGGLFEKYFYDEK